MHSLFRLHPLTRGERRSLADKIAAIEKTSAGEVRIALQRKRLRNERDLSLHDLALRNFRRLGMENTRDRTGVLIFLLLGERKLQILGDAGIHAKLGEAVWARIAEEIAGHCRAGRLHDGLMAGLTRVGARLAEHFPARPGDRNELPDRVDLS